jgi:hypothetical protein
MFELAKNFIVEGLTYKIDQKEKNSLGKDLQINIKPRVYFEGGALPGRESDPSNPLGAMFN